MVSSAARRASMRIVAVSVGRVHAASPGRRSGTAYASLGPPHRWWCTAAGDCWQTPAHHHHHHHHHSCFMELQQVRSSEGPEGQRPGAEPGWLVCTCFDNPERKTCRSARPCRHSAVSNVACTPLCWWVLTRRPPAGLGPGRTRRTGSLHNVKCTPCQTWCLPELRLVSSGTSFRVDWHAKCIYQRLQLSDGARAVWNSHE